MRKVLVIGASGFIGKQLTQALLAQGYEIRCLARNPARVQDLATAGCEVIQGDISDLPLVQSAVDSVEAVYISIHTLSPQASNGASPRFMEVEKNGVQNVITACHSCGVHRMIYVTSLGISLDEPSEWLRERWHTEQLLLDSGLDATVIRPGYVVGEGGRGFDMVVSNARRRIAISLSGDCPKMRTIAVNDLVYYLVGVLNEPRSYGQRLDVGNDDVLSMNQLIDITSDVLGRTHPIKLQIPSALLGALAPLIERIIELPSGAMKGLADSLEVDMIGDPIQIRTILPRPLLSFRQAVKRALAIE